MNINIDIPCSDTASSRISERWEKIIVDAVGLGLRDITATVTIKINNPDIEEPSSFDQLPAPQNDCMIDPWEDVYTDPLEPWPQFFADGSAEEAI